MRTGLYEKYYFVLCFFTSCSCECNVIMFGVSLANGIAPQPPPIVSKWKKQKKFKNNFFFRFFSLSSLALNCVLGQTDSDFQPLPQLVQFLLGTFFNSNCAIVNVSRCHSVGLWICVCVSIFEFSCGIKLSKKANSLMTIVGWRCCCCCFIRMPKTKTETNSTSVNKLVFIAI